MTTKALRLRPLAKPKFITDTTTLYERLTANLPPSRVCHPLGSKGGTKLEQQARRLWLLAYHAWENANQFLGPASRYHELYVDTIKAGPEISSMVWVDQLPSTTDRFLAVGQLVGIDRLPRPGAKRVYEADGGPAYFSSRYELKLLDGSTIYWTNCALRRLLTLRDTVAIDAYLKTEDGRAAGKQAG